MKQSAKKASPAGVFSPEAFSAKAKAFPAKKILTAAVCALVLLFAGISGAANYFVSFALDSEYGGGSEPETIPPEKLAVWESLLPLAERVEISSRDGLRLAGFLFSPAAESTAAESIATESAAAGSTAADTHTPGRENDCVIAVHGYKSQPASMALIAARYLSEGWTVLVPAQRAHAQSEGRYIGMGFFEKDDVAGWTDFLVARNPEARILLHGVSMGAATVMLATASPLPANVLAAVEDCGYTSVKDEFTAQLAEMFSLPYFPMIPAASLVSKLRAGYFFGEADCAEAVARSAIPTLFIHGDRDTFVPFPMLDTLYRAASCEKEMLVVPGAEHAEAAEVAPALYWDAVSRFVARYFD